MRTAINIGLAGLGTIGGGVATILRERRETIARQVGCPLVLRRAADLDEGRRQALGLGEEVFVRDARALLEDPEIDIFIELIGGERPALDLIREALDRGKHVVTANKEVLSKHGPELLALADRRKVGLFYEASVGGGIPLIAPLKRNLQVNNITSIHTIINGTTNYILTRMEKAGVEFEAALKEAQSLGYAEADPSSDIEGYDAAYKIAILATIAFHTDVRPPDVYREGITRIAAADFRYARELGYIIKLLAIARRDTDALDVRVHPALVPMLERNAWIGGCDGVAVGMGAALVGQEPVGTMPHALILIMGDTVSATKAFDEVLSLIHI